MNIFACQKRNTFGKSISSLSIQSDCYLATYAVLTAQ